MTMSTVSTSAPFERAMTPLTVCWDWPAEVFFWSSIRASLCVMPTILPVFVVPSLIMNAPHPPGVVPNPSDLKSVTNYR